MAKAKTLCNVCGKEFDMWDEQEDLGLHTRFGYGTKFDGDSIDLDMRVEEVNYIQLKRTMIY